MVWKPKQTWKEIEKSKRKSDYLERKNKIMKPQTKVVLQT